MHSSAQIRFWGIDLARFLAIVGMMAAHLLVLRSSSSWLPVVTAGFPSTLFAVIGGFGLVFAARRYVEMGNRKAALAAGITRGALILFLGLLLELLPPHPIAVILVYYGAALLVLAPAIYVSSRILVLLAIALAFVGPFLIAATEHPGALDYSGPFGLLRSVFIGGTYPVITWVVYMIAGIVLCRWLLQMAQQGKTAEAAGKMLLGGIATGASAWAAGNWYLHRVIVPEWAPPLADGRDSAVVVAYFNESWFGSPAAPGWTAIFQVSPHSGTVVDILRTGGLSVALIGLCLLIAVPWLRAPLPLRPFVGAGQAPLTSYTLHLVMTAYSLSAAGGIEAYFSRGNPLIDQAFGIQLTIIVLLGAFLSWTGKRGPLEWLVSRAGQAAAQSVGSSTQLGRP